MSNLGNTGQRYKLVKLVEIRVEGDKIRHILECGHSYLSVPGYDGIEESAEIDRQRIGKRQRCNECN